MARYLPRPLKLCLRQIKTSFDRVVLATCALTAHYRCPLCNYPVRAFLPLEDSYRRSLQQYGWKYRFEDAETMNVAQYSCPFCQASDRDRLYCLYLRRYFKSLSPNTPVLIIEFAPSPPLSAFIKKLISKYHPAATYRTADLLMETVDDRVDLENMHIYSDNSIDFFLCSHILEHVNDDQKALSEIYRILKPGGRGILMVPINLVIRDIDEEPSLKDPAERWRRFGQDDHVRLYSKQGFIQRVRSANFLLYQFDNNFFGSDIFRKHGISNQSVLYVVEKPFN